MEENGYSFKNPVNQAPVGTGKRKSHEVWYVARVRIGAEENVRLRCLEQMSPRVLKDCYVFRYEEKRKILGQWTVQEKILFPGYVFFVSARPDAQKINEQLRYIEGVIELLEMDDGPVMLGAEEIDFLLTVSGHGQTAKVSEGVIERSQIKVYSGPLVGKEKYIRKIDRHKRKAFLEMPMFGATRKIQMGLEIVSKT